MGEGPSSSIPAHSPGMWLGPKAGQGELDHICPAPLWACLTLAPAVGPVALSSHRPGNWLSCRRSQQVREEAYLQKAHLTSAPSLGVPGPAHSPGRRQTPALGLVAGGQERLGTLNSGRQAGTPLCQTEPLETQGCRSPRSGLGLRQEQAGVFGELGTRLFPRGAHRQAQQDAPTRPPCPLLWHEKVELRARGCHTATRPPRVPGCSSSPGEANGSNKGRKGVQRRGKCPQFFGLEFPGVSGAGVPSCSRVQQGGGSRARHSRAGARAPSSTLAAPAPTPGWAPRPPPVLLSSARLPG